MIRPVNIEEVIPKFRNQLEIPFTLYFNKYIYNIGEVIYIGEKVREKKVKVGDIVYFGTVGCPTFKLPNKDGLYEDVYIVRDINLFCKLKKE